MVTCEPCQGYGTVKQCDKPPQNESFTQRDVQLSRAQQVSISLLPCVELTLKLCTTSDCCRVLCRIVSPAQTVPSGVKSPQTSETERKTTRKVTEQKVQDVAADQFRKNDKFTKKTKGTDNTAGQTLHQEVEQDETEAAADGHDNGCDNEVSRGWIRHHARC